MMNRQVGSVRSILTTAGLLASVYTVLPAPVAFADDTPQTKAAPSADQRLQQAADFLAVSKTVRAKAILIDLASPESVATLSDTQRTRALSLLRSADARLKSMDPIEVSLQKADLALEQNDLQLARSQAASVARASKATPDQQRQADDLLASIDKASKAASINAGDSLAVAINAFDLGNYAQAKTLLAALAKSGATMTPAQAAKADDYRSRLVQLEQTRGELFQAAPAAGMLQPGVIKKREPGEAPATESKPADQPATDAKPSTTAEQPADKAPAAEQPASGQPAAAPTPAQPTDDLIAVQMRGQAANLIAEADRAYDASQWNSAQQKYQTILDRFASYITADQQAHAKQRLEDAKLRLRVNVGAEGNTLGDITQVRLLAKQQFVAEFNNYVAESRKSLESGDIETARHQSAQAGLVLNTNRALCNESEFQNYRKQITDLDADVEKKQNEVQAAEAARRSKELQDQTIKARADGEQVKTQRIRENIDRIRALQSERKYKEALDLVDQVLFLDPLNPTALLLKEVLNDVIIYQQYHVITDKLSRSAQLSQLDDMQAVIPPRNVIDYPDEWPELSKSRGQSLAFQDTPETRAVLAMLDTKRIPKVEFTDNTFEQVLAFIKTVAGNVNMNVDWPSLEEKSIPKDKTISLSLSNATVKTVLEAVLNNVSGSADNASRAGWTVTDGVLIIASEEALRRSRATVIYDVRDLLLDVRDKTDYPRFDLTQALQSGGSGGGGGTGPFQNSQQQQLQPGQEYQKPIKDRMNDLMHIVEGLIDKDGWVNNGGDTGSWDLYKGSLIITNTPKNHRAIEGLLAQLRKVLAMQISVETRFLLVNQEYLEKIGFDLDVYFNANSKAYARDNATVGGTLPFSQWNTQGLSYTVPLPDGSTYTRTRFTPTAAGDRWGPTYTSQNSTGIADTLMNSNFASTVSQAAGGGNALTFAASFMSDVEVDFLVQATQADRRTVQLTAPRLTFTNGQFANTYIADQLTYVQTVQAVTATSSVGFQPTPGYLTTGAILFIGGTISADRRYVTMDVLTQSSQLKKLRQIPVEAVVAGQVVSSAGNTTPGVAVTATAQVEYPEIEVQSVNTVVTIPDQGTVMLGGQRAVTEIEVETGVPVLSKIPILNRFFSTREMSKEERSLLILLKPTILIQNENEERAFPGLQNALRTGIGG